MFFFKALEPSMQGPPYTWNRPEPWATASQSGRAQNWWGSELGEDLANDIVRGRRKDARSPLSEKGGERADPFRQVG